MVTKIDANSFYREYHGHKVDHLQSIYTSVSLESPKRSLIFLAGDSSLDNKYWLNKENDKSAINGYETFLSPPKMRPDVNYFINKRLFDQHDNRYFCINAAIEESTIGARKLSNTLLAQDIFIQQYISNNDILVVSLGGNDLALRPTPSTAWNMLLMNYLNSLQMIEQGPSVAWGINYFISMFKDDIKNYIIQIIGDKRPKKVIVCMIYYPDEKMTGSWADNTLGYLGYNSNPKSYKQQFIKFFFMLLQKY